MINNSENYVVFVVDQNNRPLDVTTNFGRVSFLLDKGYARVYKQNPFTIKLKREVDAETKNYTLGIDPGRENIGVAVTDSSGRCIFKAELRTGNKAVTKTVSDRAG